MMKVPNCKGAYHARRSRKSFQVVYPLGWSDEKKRYVEHYEEVLSEADAIVALKDINDFVYHGGLVEEVPACRRKDRPGSASNTVLVSEFITTFCKLRKEQKKVAARTVTSDHECLSRIIPYIGAMPLHAVSSGDIDAMYASMRSDGSKNKSGKPYSGTTLQKTHACLSLMFKKAMSYDYVDSNPCDKVEKPKRDTPEKESLDPESAQALFTYIVNTPLASQSVGVLLSLNCGVRLSEMLALTWCDFNNGCIRVHRSMERDSQNTKPTKNEEERVVPCPPPLLPVLEEWRNIQQAWWADLGMQWDASVPIVHSRTTGHILQRSFERWWSKKRLCFPIPDGFNFHGLRHTYVTLMNRDCGIDDRTTRSMSGHKSNQAFHGYTHTNDEWKREAASRLGSIIAPADHAKICQNCKYWTASPHDIAKGACWIDASDAAVPVVSAASACSVGCFAMRTRAAG